MDDLAVEEKLNGHQIRSERSTRLLIKAAGDLVAEGGYKGLTLATVGERAGYSRSLATARFGSKSKLLDALVDHIINRWNLTQVLPRTTGKCGHAALMIMLESIRDSYSRDPHSLRVLYALMFEALGPGVELRDRFAALHREMRETLVDVIDRGVSDGSITSACDSEVEAQFLVATLRGLGYQWRLDPEVFDPIPCLDYLIRTTHERLVARHTPDGPER